MAMMGSRDKATHYNILDEDGMVVGNASKSKVMQLKVKLEKELGKKLKIELVETG